MTILATTVGVTAPWTPYCGAAPGPAEVLGRWNGDPALIAALALAGWLGWSHAVDRRAFAAALAVLTLLFVSPLCALTSALFSARIAHHVALVAVAAPLLARAFDLRTARLVPATLGGLAVFYAWHVPTLYAAALSSDVTFWAMQLALGASAVAFWAAVRTASAPAAVAALLVTMVGMGLLGALLTFAGTPLYAPHLASTLAWGMLPIEDQQLGGLLMWAPGALLYLGAALVAAWPALEGERSPTPA